MLSSFLSQKDKKKRSKILFENFLNRTQSQGYMLSEASGVATEPHAVTTNHSAVGLVLLMLFSE